MYPVTYTSLNYAPVAVGFTLLVALVWWFTNARTWFKGPKQGWGVGDDDAALGTKDAEVIVA